MTHSVIHQAHTSDIGCALLGRRALGQEVLHQFGACLTMHTYLRPDVIGFRAEQMSWDGWYVRGAPQLAVEVTSPASLARDFGIKKDTWARAGVPSYWIADLFGGVSHLHIFELDQGEYVQVARLTPGESHRVTKPFPCELDPGKIFEDLSRFKGVSMRQIPRQGRVGPELPPPDELIDVVTFGYRWPMGAEKVELWAGIPTFYGEWDDRDIEMAERAFPGRIVELDQPSGLPGTLVVRPAGQPLPEELRLLREHTYAAAMSGGSVGAAI